MSRINPAEAVIPPCDICGKCCDDCECDPGLFAPQTPTPTDPREEAFQSRVLPWLLTCFGQEIANDKVERNHRFIEEALELVQSTGCTRSEALQLVDYVFDRPAGIPNQEVGGVMVTLAALCLAQGLDMHHAGEQELARIWTKVEKIREKQAAKPKHSPLPAAHESTNSKLAAEIAELKAQAISAKGYFVRRVANNIREWMANNSEKRGADNRSLEEVILASDVGAITHGDALVRKLDLTEAELRQTKTALTTLRAELEAARKERDDTIHERKAFHELADQILKICGFEKGRNPGIVGAVEEVIQQRDTALAAKDAAEKERDAAIHERTCCHEIYDQILVLCGYNPRGGYPGLVGAVEKVIKQRDAAENALRNYTDGLASVDQFHAGAVDDIAHALAQELEEAELSADDPLMVNRDKLKAIARRVIMKALATLADPCETLNPALTPEAQLSALADQVANLKALASSRATEVTRLRECLESAVADFRKLKPMIGDSAEAIANLYKSYLS